MLQTVDSALEPKVEDAIVEIARSAAADMLEGKTESGRVGVFEGTRWECEAFLNSFFNIQRKIVEGARSKASEDDAPKYDEILKSLDMAVYRVTVRGLGMVASEQVRPENAYRAMRMRTALEMFDAITEDVHNEGHDVVQ